MGRIDKEVEFKSYGLYSDVAKRTEYTVDQVSTVYDWFLRQSLKEIKFEDTYAVGWLKRDNLMGNRLVKIYWRSPAYNLARMALSAVIALLLGSMFIPLRDTQTYSEAQITRCVVILWLLSSRARCNIFPHQSCLSLCVLF